MEKIYTCKQVAERYSVKIETVWEWIRKKKLRAARIGKMYRVRESDLTAFETCTADAPAEDVVG